MLGVGARDGVRDAETPDETDAVGDAVRVAVRVVVVVAVRDRVPELVGVGDGVLVADGETDAEREGSTMRAGSARARIVRPSTTYSVVPDALMAMFRGSDIRAAVPMPSADPLTLLPATVETPPEGARTRTRVFA